jgi:hypothetical protein
MKKINFEMFNYLVFTVLTVVSVTSLLYLNFFHQEWKAALNILIPVSGCFAGGWLVFTMIFLPTFSSFKIVEKRGR